jgi:hypothetical protein
VVEWRQRRTGGAQSAGSRLNPYHGLVGPSLLMRRNVTIAASVLLFALLASLPVQPVAAIGEEASRGARLTEQQAAGALLPTNRIVAYYGNPLSPILGRLGEAPPDQMIARLRQTANYYAEADPSRPVKPALELITPLAQGSPGEDGLYRARLSSDVTDEVARWADDNDLLLILDVQVGRSSVADELPALLPYLKRPNTHLALDPEFAMGPGEVPGRTIGSLDAADVNIAIETLAGIVQSDNLPPKVLIVHRFLPSMLTGADAIEADPRVQVVIDMDGFGSPAAKISKYHAFIRDAGADFGGIKLFYKYDPPLLDPEDVVGLDPPPDVVIYQ